VLSVVIPVRNGVPLLERTLERVLEFLEDEVDGELIIVSDGCTDDPSSFMAPWLEKEDRLRFERLDRHRGKGAAIRRGVLSARGDMIAYLDADLSAAPQMLIPLLRSVEDGADLACGSRHLPGSTIDVPQGILRVILGSLFRRVVQLVTGLPVKDTQCGCKVFRSEKLIPIFDQLQEEGFAFDIEILLAARRHGLVIEELPVVWSDHPRSSLRPIRDGIRMLGALIRLVRHDRRSRRQ
jgi:glycosyltransferase involved in cell wall biosynthesis